MMRAELAPPDCFDPFAEGLAVSLYDTYRCYRQAAPVHLGISYDPRRARAWYLFRRADVLQATSSPALGRELEESAVISPSPTGEANAFAAALRGCMLFRDPPNHTRLRASVGRAFAPKLVAALRPRVESVVGYLLDKVYAEREFDLLVELAYPLPILLIADMFGIRPRDHARFRAWSQAFVEGMDVRASPVAAANASRATLELTSYLEAELAGRSSSTTNDLLGVLASAEREAGGLTREELLANCLLIITAGHETTANLIGNGVYALLTQRAQWELLRERPELVKSAFHELLRFDSPVQLLNRVALCDLELAGQEIRRGELVNCVIGAANRDPEAFTRPDELLVSREGPRPLSFGHGIHHCLGAALAQLEVEVALTALLDRFPALRISEEPRRNQRLDFRGFSELRVATRA